jgi:Tfp pilus assembly protein PilZ
MTRRLTLQLVDLGALRRAWVEVCAGRLLVPGAVSLPVMTPVLLELSVLGAPMSLELPGEVVFVQRGAQGAVEGLGLRVEASAHVREAAEHMMAERWGEAAVSLLLGASAPPVAGAGGGGEAVGVRRRREVPRAVASTPLPPSKPVTPARPATPRPAAPPPPARAATPKPEAPKAGKGQDLVLVEREARAFLKKMGGADHYQVMGVGRAAERGDIRRAYSVLMLRFHPDNFYRKASPTLLKVLEEVYQRVTEAYEALMIPERRTAYDMEIGNFRGGGEQDLGRWRRSSFESAQPQKARMGKSLWEEGERAWRGGDRQTAISKLKLALQFHPHLEEARALLDKLSQG